MCNHYTLPILTSSKIRRAMNILCLFLQLEAVLLQWGTDMLHLGMVYWPLLHSTCDELIQYSYPLTLRCLTSVICVIKKENFYREVVGIGMGEGWRWGWLMMRSSSDLVAGTVCV